MNLPSPPAQQPGRHARDGILFLDHQRNASQPRCDPRRPPGIAARHHDRLRTESLKEICHVKEGDPEARERPERSEPRTAVEALNREQGVLQAPSRENARLDPPGSPDEEGTDFRADPDQRIGQRKGRVQVTAGTATGEDDHGTKGIMHGPSSRPEPSGQPKSECRGPPA